MIDLMKTIRPEKAFYNVPEKIVLEKITAAIEDNNCTDIKYRTLNPSSYIPSIMSYETYIFLQALTKVLQSPIEINMIALSAPEDSVIRNFNDLRNKQYNNNPYRVNCFYISKSSFNRSSFTNERNKICSINTELDKMLNNLLPNNNILGVTRTPREINFFLDKTVYNPQDVEYTLLALTYRFFVPTETEYYPAVHKAFKKLLNELNTYHNSKNTNYFLDSIYVIYKEYLDSCPEYKINKQRQLEKLMTSLKERKLQEYKDDVDNKRANMSNLLLKLEEATQAFKKANLLYTALRERSDDEYSAISLQEITDLLKRSPIIKKFEITDSGIIFFVEQPIQVNSKEDFERILKHRPESTQTTLLKEVFIDEKYKLYTFANIYINLIRERVARFDEFPDNLTALPNPHIMGFNCFGQYSSIIGNLITEGKYLEALEECFEAASGLNWSDNPVINKLEYYFEYYENVTCIEDSNKNRISFAEYERRIQNEAVPNQTEETATTNNTVGETEDGPADTPEQR